MNTKTRFAPSPTGLIHLGNARTALFNALLAIRDNCKFLLRIEDTDREHSRTKFFHSLMEDLRWLGLDWHEGPVVGGEHGPYLQSEREAIYQSYYDELKKQGRTYPCFCSAESLRVVRKDQISSGQTPRYNGMCTNLTNEEVNSKIASGKQPALRFRVPRGQLIKFVDLIRNEQKFYSQNIGDFIIRRQDSSPSFLFSNVVDDALMGVTYVLRGDDHLSNTPRQMMIMEALGFSFPTYGHISMVVGSDYLPLSKRHSSDSVKEMRESGYFAGAVVNYLARLGHCSDNYSYQSIRGLANDFNIEKLGRAPVRFDIASLHYWQQAALNTVSDNYLWEWMGERIHHLVPVKKRQLFVETVRSNILFPNDAFNWSKILFIAKLDLNNDAVTVVKNAGTGFYQHALTALVNSGMDYPVFVTKLKKLSKVNISLLNKYLRNYLG